jgi:hypothetical protein
VVLKLKPLADGGLGRLGAGILQPDPLAVSGYGHLFFSAVHGHLDTTNLDLDPSVGGGVFTASSDQISVLLQPSSGSSLVAGTDYALITVSNQASPVPEPDSIFLLAPVVLAAWLMRQRLRPLKPNQPL